MDLSILEQIGLSKAEVHVYLALLRLGPVPSNRVVRETTLRKSTVYETLRRLHEKGLISSYTKDKKTYFEATEPGRLGEFVEDKKRELEGYGEAISSLAKELIKEYGNIKPQAEAHILLGLEGYKNMRRDVLRNSQGELLIIGGIGREWDALSTFFENWNKTRLLKGIKERVLAKREFKGKDKVLKEHLIKGFESRYLPEGMEGPAVINVYSDRVANVVWRGNYPICFLMINKETADAYRSYFNYLWKLAKD